MTVRSFFESEHYRVFVKEGSVMKTRPDFTDPSERYLFLCSDLLLIAQVYRTKLDYINGWLCYREALVNEVYVYKS